MRKNTLFVLIFAVFCAIFLVSCFDDANVSRNEDSNVEYSENSSESEAPSKEEMSETIKEESSDIVSQVYSSPEEYIRYGFSEAVEKAFDSVVSINVTSSVSGGFYGEYTVEESGSGVIVSESGYIITNCHVVKDAKNIKVFLSDGTEYDASLVGKDAKTDLAVIKIEVEKQLKVAEFSDSSTLKVGDFVFSIGNALGTYPNTVTMGIISALSRDVKVNNEQMQMIQTDAALNSGNSGGGLFDSHGYLVGIVAAKDANDNAECVGFAIPSDVTKNVVNDIISYGYVTGRPTLGFETVDITSLREASYYGVNWIGVYISSVSEGSFGETAGLKPRDYIYSVNGEVITTSDRLEEILGESSIGDTLFLEVWRGKSSIDVVLKVGEEMG